MSLSNTVPSSFNARACVAHQREEELDKTAALVTPLASKSLQVQADLAYAILSAPTPNPAKTRSVLPELICDRHGHSPVPRPNRSMRSLAVTYCSKLLTCASPVEHCSGSHRVLGPWPCSGSDAETSSTTACKCQAGIRDSYVCWLSRQAIRLGLRLTGQPVARFDPFVAFIGGRHRCSLPYSAVTHQKQYVECLRPISSTSDHFCC
jgi:hypothetical protein